MTNELLSVVEKLENGKFIYAHVDFNFTEHHYYKDNLKLNDKDIGEVYIQSKFEDFKTMWEHAKDGEVAHKDVFKILYNLGKLRFIAARGTDETNGLVRTMFDYVPTMCYLIRGGLGLTPSADRQITSSISRYRIDRSEQYRYTIEKMANYCELVVKNNDSPTKYLVHNKYIEPIYLNDCEVEELKSLKYTDVRKNEKNQTCISFKEWFIKSVTDRFPDLEGPDALAFFLTPDEFGEYPDLSGIHVPYDEFVNDDFKQRVKV